MNNNINPHTLLRESRELYMEQLRLFIVASNPLAEAEAYLAMKRIKREAIDPLVEIINQPANHTPAPAPSLPEIFCAKATTCC